MGYIELKVRDAGLWTENHTAASVVVMYQGVANFFVVRDDAPRHARRDPNLKMADTCTAYSCLGPSGKKSIESLYSA